MSTITMETGEESHSGEGGGSAAVIGDSLQQWWRLSSITEVEEEGGSSDLFEITGVPSAGNNGNNNREISEAEGSLFSFDFQNKDDVVYVAVGKSDSGVDALAWALNHAVNPSSTHVFLIHVFPEIRNIPTPLGRLPITSANPEQQENYMVHERSKRKEFFHRFLQLCSASKVKAETIVIESDVPAKAILGLIPILNIRKLILGSSRSNLRKLRSSRRSGGGMADQILHNAPEFCEVKIICEGKEMDQISIADSFSSRGTSPRGTPRGTSPRSTPRSTDTPKSIQQLHLQPVDDRTDDDSSAMCTCFR